MQTEKINFTGVYRIPNTPENVKLVNEKVTPMYKLMKHESVIGMEGENPLAYGVEFVKEIISSSQNSSKEWLMMNARNFGIELPRLNKENLLIISGQKDILKFAEFFQERIKANIKTPLQKFFDFFKTKTPNSQYLPEHLKVLPEFLEIYNKEAALYREFLSGRNVIDVKTPQELLTKMMTERQY